MTAAVSIYKSPAGERAVLALYDSMLARWPVPHAASNVATRHGTTFVVSSGVESAPPLVLLHGAGTNSAMWAGDVADYAHRHRVHAVDLLGEPGRSAAHRLEWEGPAHAEWLDDVLDGLHIEKATFSGLSQGGWATLEFAVARPERVRALVLLSPGGIVPDKLSFLIRVLPLLFLGRWGTARIGRMVLGGQSVPAEVERGMGVLMTHFKPRIGALPIFADAELRRLTMPVLLLMGGKDVLRDAEKVTARMQRCCRRSRRSRLPTQATPW